MRVGIIGLGIMGSAYAKNLRAAGFDVEGADPAEAGRENLTALGGTAHEAAGPWLEGCAVVIISVASPKVLAAVTADLGRLLHAGQVVMETGTFALADKMAARDAVAPSGADILDCPVSGTGAQAARKDLVLMASGAPEAIETARPVMEALGHTIMNAGAYGMGSRLKYVANHAVAVHNTAAAETLHYAMAQGLDPHVVYKM
jgi:3-hydroxyisobutyrate dehydrogenase-like beta-hydroxyacid dehydrogenase